MPVTLATDQDILGSYDDGTYFVFYQITGTGFNYGGGVPISDEILGEDVLGGVVDFVVIDLFDSPGGGAKQIQFYASDLNLDIASVYTPGGALNSIGTLAQIALTAYEDAASRHQSPDYAAFNFVASDNPLPDTTNQDTNDIWIAETVTELRGGLGDDVLETGAGNATIFGGWGDDFISVFDNGSGARLAGNGGNDDVNGGQFGDRLFGGDGNDVLNGYGGDDSMYGGAGNDILIGGIDDDFLRGGADNDFLNGDDGDNRLFGDAGNDTLFSSGEGRDTMFGGEGADQFVIEVGDLDGPGDLDDNTLATEFALIRDFDTSQDILQLMNINALNTPAFGETMFDLYAQNEGNNVVYDDGQARFKLVGVQVEDFDETNFFDFGGPPIDIA